jgi:hypothetical protein
MLPHTPSFSLLLPYNFAEEGQKKREDKIVIVCESISMELVFLIHVLGFTCVNIIDSKRGERQEYRVRVSRKFDRK